MNLNPPKKMEKRKAVVILHFESFTLNHVSIHVVGMVKVVNSTTIQEFSSLIKSLSDERTIPNAHVYRITEEMCANAPLFPHVLRQMELFVGDCSSIIYCSETDRDILQETCEFYGLGNSPFCRQEIINTLRLGKKSLKASCGDYGIELKENYNPLDYTRTCAELYLKAKNMGTVKSKPVSCQYERCSSALDNDLYVLLPDKEIENKDTKFYHKHIITIGIFSRYPNRNELLAKLQKLGAINLKTVTKATDIAIIGSKTDPSQIIQLRENYDIQILTEIGLYDILDS